jgi:cation diffusion facilitator family transporter
MSQTNSTTAVLYAFAANLGIALAKSGAAISTGSGALLAEAIHSFADCGNQVLLLIGMKRSAKEATQKHPMGFERESYIWSMMVAFMLFSVGGVFSIHEGWQRIDNPHEIENGGVALLILLIAVALEYFSLKGALAAMADEKGDRTLWQWFRETHSSELMVVTGEDLAALLGLVIAFVMLGLTLLTGNPLFDAAGSMLIGFLLILVALGVGVEVHSLLIGESANAEREGVDAYLKEQGSVLDVLNLWAINHGNSVMISVKVRFPEMMQVGEAVGIINRMEQEMKTLYPRIRWIFFELDEID